MGSEVRALDRGTLRPLHEQLSERLRAELLSTCTPGDQIPTEEDICRTYGLSRVTVRRAIQTLVTRGLLIRRQGKGTFLVAAKPHIVYAIDRFGPFVESFAASGEEVETRLVDYAWVEAELVPFCFRPDASTLVYERLYETAGMPHALVQISLPERLGARVSRSDAAASGVYEILQTKLAVVPVRASFNISTELPSAPLATRLKVSPTTPLLLLERVSFDATGTAIERTVHHLLPDIYKLSVNVQAPAA